MQLSTRRRIAHLGARGALRRADASALLGALQRFAPGAAEVGITHNDFCAENLVEDAAGRLVPIDNEGLRRGFFDYDLARTWYRWPMPEADWLTFAARYGVVRRPDTAHASFWRIAAVVKSAALRATRGVGDVTTPIGRLRALLDAAGP
jgi:Ser/Thr protein kinase RdoA (MazF antagonist)